ncbi:aminotransferase class I/II-fold pyridoxal phosphate-dependent enzyme [Desulfovibrio aerotolerans]|uniref:Aminotransferase n=1 Tax=Solidesulfovibrio aerotolerans TaxID=295255 RepID=A0A7C9ILN2_9BACT|nr:pyridoxal phosphate-dependent aminotransferase [Solidesulfovibrio aerotolerans]MYL83765.1 aminotransferase class I/II-fold pyridoxal phosphate-dependent enzyme [Solidesulfovibrio aerotolerans]
MRTALRMRLVAPSATLGMAAKAADLRRQGKAILDLSAGEPDFNTPQHIKDAAKKAIDDNFTRYTPVPGIPTLREAVTGYYKKLYGVPIPKEAVIATNGGKQALYNLFLAVLNPGDEVLVPSPYWVSYPDMIRLAGAEPVPVPSRLANGFLVSVEDLDRAATPATRALVLNSPSNPTGAHYTAAELDAIVDWAVSRDIYIVSDEIYDRLVYDPAKPASMAASFAIHPDNVAVVGGLAKSFAMTGWRMGYCVAHPDVIRAMTTLQSQSTSNICSIVQKAAIAALTGPLECVEEMRQAFARRRDLCLSIIKTWDRAVCPTPAGAFYLFPSLSEYYTAAVPNSTVLSEALLTEAGVATVPGVAFGEDRCVRLSYATSDETLEKALTAMGAFLKKLS